MKVRSVPLIHHQAGFSVIELLVVLVVITIGSTIAIIYLTAHQKLYKPDDESLLITDILQEARQRSLTQRETMRVEVNLTTNTVRLIDENFANTVDDDRVLKTINMFPQTDVMVNDRPAEIGYNPPEPLTASNAVFKPSVYPTSITQSVCTIRFLSNGTAVDAGNNELGTGSTPTGVTLHIWSPKKATPTESDIARAITVIGTTGTIRLWEFDKSLSASNKWKDSRRYGTYGGGGTGGNTNTGP